MAADDRHAELVNRLTDGIAALTTSAEWHRYLAFQARFHRYSTGNVILILSQCPDATRVAGFRAWQAHGRSVRKGERAIWILAPLVRSRPSDIDQAERVCGFKWVPVFDVGQTDGAELPEACRPLSGEDGAADYQRLIEIAHLIGFSVEDHRFEGPTNGDCCHQRQRIRVNTARSNSQRVKTLAHELGHAILHERVVDLRAAELEAESTAYVVCHHLGIETGDYSFGYVASWAGGGVAAIAAIKASCQRIQEAANMIIGSLSTTEGGSSTSGIPRSYAPES